MKYKIHPVALFRLSVLGPLASRDHFHRGELKKTFKTLASQTYQIPDGKRVHLSEKTIEHWYYRWKADGIDGLSPTTRSDKGVSQLDSQVQEAIFACKKDNPARSIKTIINYLEATGVVQKNMLSRSTVHRLLQNQHLSKRIPADIPTIERRAFESEFAGNLWYSDVMHGPTVQTSHGMRKVYLITIFDDASRLVCHSQFCLDETVISVEFVLKEALLKRGIPMKLMIDNGPAYRAESLQSVCARLKIHLIHSRPYEPESKGKIERWHRVVREQFLTELNLQVIHSLDDLNARLWVWIEELYHRTPHSALKNRQTPLERFQQDLLKMQPLGSKARYLDDYFYHRIKRRIKNDATFSFKSLLFEVPFQFAGEEVYLVFDASKNEPKYIESLTHQRLGPVHLLNKLENNTRHRHRPKNLTDSKSSPKKSLVEELYKKSNKKYDLTK